MRALTTGVLFLGLLFSSAFASTLLECFVKVENLTAEQPATSPEAVAF